MKPRRMEQIGDCTLYLGDCLKIMPTLNPVDHIFCDPPYEENLHASKKAVKRGMRIDGGVDLRAIDFSSIDLIRADFINLIPELCGGWLIAFCTVEGVAKWADTINPSVLKYKRACVWIKPDSTPQLNGQGPAQGAECFVTAWCGPGFAKWNAGGKRGVYRHNVNPPDRHGGHPTEKPWRLFAELLMDFTQPKSLILDPFMGGGTTGVACIKTGRKFIGIEENEKYFDIACRRIEEVYKQPDMFIQPPAKAVQEALI